jgi:hypothetical protein
MGFPFSGEIAYSCKNSVLIKSNRIGKILIRNYKRKFFDQGMRSQILDDPSRGKKMWKTPCILNPNVVK